MKRLNINFTTGKLRYWRQDFNKKYVFAYLLTIGALITSCWFGALLYQTMNANEEIATLHQELGKRLVMPSTTQEKPIAISAEKVRALNIAISKLNLPWRDLFDAIESATPKTVALISLQPDGMKKSLYITAEAKGYVEMLAYIEALKEQGLFSYVGLIKHEINKQDANMPYRFDIEIHWRS